MEGIVNKLLFELQETDNEISCLVIRLNNDYDDYGEYSCVKEYAEKMLKLCAKAEKLHKIIEDLDDIINERF